MEKQNWYLIAHCLVLHLKPVHLLSLCTYVDIRSIFSFAGQSKKKNLLTSVDAFLLLLLLLDTGRKIFVKVA